jgi:MFS family permease
VIVPSFFLLSAGGGILALLAILVDARTTLPVLPFLFLAGFVAGSAHGFLYPALSLLLIDLAPDARRGSAVGLFSSVILAGHALGSMLFGYVAHGLGYGVLWTALTLLVALGFGASFRLSP